MGRVDRLPLQLGDDVAGLDARPGARAVGCHRLDRIPVRVLFVDPRALTQRQAVTLLEASVDDVVGDADERPRQLLAGESLLHYRLGDIYRTGKADACGRRSLRRCDADDQAGTVDERSATVAGIYGGVSLDPV